METIEEAKKYIRDHWEEGCTIKVSFDDNEFRRAGENQYEYEDRWMAKRFAEGYGEDCFAACDETMYAIVNWAVVTVFNHLTETIVGNLNTMLTPTSGYISALCVVDGAVVFVKSGQPELHVYSATDNEHLTLPAGLVQPTVITPCPDGFYIEDVGQGILKVSADGTITELQVLDPPQPKVYGLGVLRDGKLVVRNSEDHIFVHEQ